MNDQFFQDKFTPLFLNLASINLRIIKNKELTEEQKRFYENLKYIIPVLNRLNDKKTILTIDDALSLNIDHQNKKQKLNEEIINKVNNNYLFQDESDKDENLKDKILDVSSDEFEEQSEDLEGDEQVNELTVKSLEQLKKIKDGKWMTFKEIMKNENEGKKDFKNGYDSELIEESSYDSESSYEHINLDIEEDQHNEDPSALQNIPLNSQFSRPIEMNYY